MIADLLFLSHRIPYPPNKGDKIRSYHILKYLASRYRVHLGAFVDDPDDWRYGDELRKLCASVKLVKLNPKTALLRGAIGLLTGEALGMPYYRDRAMTRWINELRERVTPQAIFVFSSTMAQYVDDTHATSVLDLCDVDSEKWRQYAARHRFPMSLIYNREARLLARAEREMSKRFGAVVLVSDGEVDLFKKIAPNAASRTHTLRNGVDTAYFDPQLKCENPFALDEHAIVFTGAMDYWANADAVTWFAKEILPTIRAQRPHARFYIVGSRPSEAVRNLASDSVVVTGTVTDVRPYMHHARVIVAPLRIARGVQNKVLEALAMARPVVATDDALDGLDGAIDAGALSAKDATSFAAAVSAKLADESDNEAGRRYVCERFGWGASLALLDSLLAPVK